MTKRGDHAVVLDASIAGLTAARVFADRYERVTIVERDALPIDPDVAGRFARVTGMIDPVAKARRGSVVAAPVTVSHSPSVPA